MKSIPTYSPCCDAPVLSQVPYRDRNERRLYCHKCDRTIEDFSGIRMRRAWRELLLIHSPGAADLVYRNKRVAYARRSSPQYVATARGYEIGGPPLWTWFVDGEPVVECLGLDQCAPLGLYDEPRFYGKITFASKRDALGKLWAYLRARGVPVDVIPQVRARAGQHAWDAAREYRKAKPRRELTKRAMA